MREGGESPPLSLGHLGSEVHTQGTVPALVDRNQMPAPSGITLGSCQVLVEIEAKEAGEQLAGSRPPNEVGQHATEEEGCKQATQDPCDLGCSLLGFILCRVHRDQSV